MRRPVFPVKMSPLESGLESSGGASFCITRPSLIVNRGYSVFDPLAPTPSGVEWISNIYRSVEFLSQEVLFKRKLGNEGTVPAFH
jgi:hypothetical protein